MAIECLPVDLFEPCGIRPKALRVRHQQNEVYIRIRARGSPSMRADQNDGWDSRMHARLCEDGPSDLFNPTTIVTARFP